MFPRILSASASALGFTTPDVFKIISIFVICFSILSYKPSSFLGFFSKSPGLIIHCCSKASFNISLKASPENKCLSVSAFAGVFSNILFISLSIPTTLLSSEYKEILFSCKSGSSILTCSLSSSICLSDKRNPIVFDFVSFSCKRMVSVAGALFIFCVV